MRKLPPLLLPSLLLFALNAICRPPENWKNQPSATPQGHQGPVSYRNNCNPATKETDLNINNVRARLLTGGDMWWDLAKGSYIVPQPKPGQPEVSSLGAGNVWFGGIDPGGNLKLACQMYRTASKNDFWPGPLDENDGSITGLGCWQWDKFFRVLGENIRKHKANFEKHKLNGEACPPEEIPKDVKGWPARGNPYFFEIHQFQLPNTNQGLAHFYDENANGFYEPQLGDYPIIDVNHCYKPTFADEMVFWIFNDNGNVHTQTGSSPIKMEVQAEAFAFSTQDELNDMTFYRYKIINRGLESLDSTFFAIWIDPDLGCPNDDYIGCDSTVLKVDTVKYEDANGNPVTELRKRRRDLMYAYNMDETDGDPGGCDCGAFSTYCNEIPMVGVDFLRGPNDEHGAELGMTSFVYWPRSSLFMPTDPANIFEYYNYLTGHWGNGLPITIGGNGYNPGSTKVTKFAFSSPPNDPAGWSMCSTHQPSNDLRTLQSAGPFKLYPGNVNELIIGVPWVPNIQYPCPDLEPMLYADQVAQTFFDNCFDLVPGPDAPDLDWIELNRGLVCLLSNEKSSNNYREDYSVPNPYAPEFLHGVKLEDEQKLYRFEGYKVFQLINENVTRSELSDIEKARVVFQCDIKNKVSKVFDWVNVPGPGPINWRPVERVDGNNEGIAHSFKITEDQFAATNRALVNHKKYHYLAVAYAYNNFASFDSAFSRTGQRLNYFEGRLNVKNYTVIPRPIVDRALQANFGEGAEISSYEGLGVGHNAVELKPGEHDSILAGNNSALDYLAGRGPINVRIYDPLNVKDCEFELFIVDDDMTDNLLATDARWLMVDAATGDTLYSEASLARLNEQLIADYGISVTIAQTTDAGGLDGPSNGALAQNAVFSKPGNEWLDAVPDNQDGIPGMPTATPFHFVANQLADPFYPHDPFQAYSKLGKNWFYPYFLTWNPEPVNPIEFKLSPRWCPPLVDTYTKESNKLFSLADLNNVDIVFTKDTAKWSRCIIVETASNNYSGTGTGLGFQTESGPGWPRKSMDTRYALSVGKQDADGDGRADPDGEMDGNVPLRGMGWFPGYCIDVETGERLNIFFGENSIYNGIPDGGQIWPDEPSNGADMMFNPSDWAIRLPIDNISKFNPYSFPLGGQHFVYVTRQKYDGCAAMRQWMDPDKAIGTNKKYLNKLKAVPLITWTSMMLLAPGAKMLPYSAGLVPNDCTVSLRVDNPYGIHRTTTNGHPRYRFHISGKTAKPLDGAAINSSLDSIKVVPNPYYGYANYETSYASNIVKITNLPAKCTVTIYSLDGKFVRKYDRDEMPLTDPARTAPPVFARQILPDIEWDMRNASGLPVASGVYLVHVDAPGYGQRTLKWFGIGREFDPSGL